MTKRKIAVLGFIGIEGVLLLAALVLHAVGWEWLALFAAAAAIGVLALALAAIWKRLESKDAAAIEAVRHLEHRVDTGGFPASAEGTDTPQILIGRAAGVRQPGSSTHREQEQTLFGPVARWSAATPEAVRSARIAVIGARERVDQALPEQWASDLQLIPGIMTAQADDAGVSVVLCDSAAFTEAPWNRAIDASGTWLVQELERLKLWADASGALLVYFDHADTPVGVNTETIRRFFHLTISGDTPDTIEGAPAPAALRELHRLHGLLAAHRTGAGAL